jgi:hypothetical protein
MTTVSSDRVGPTLGLQPRPETSQSSRQEHSFFKDNGPSENKPVGGPRSGVGPLVEDPAGDSSSRGFSLRHGGEAEVRVVNHERLTEQA